MNRLKVDSEKSCALQAQKIEFLERENQQVTQRVDSLLKENSNLVEKLSMNQNIVPQTQ